MGTADQSPEQYRAPKASLFWEDMLATLVLGVAIGLIPLLVFALEIP